MRHDKINALYYPDMDVDRTTLKKAILLFDEIHFIDRPSFTFKNNFGTIGAQSPLREYEHSFRDAGVPLYVHSVQDGRVGGDLLEQIKSDINDPLFLKKFKEGLETSITFRGLHIPAGNYGDAGNEQQVAQKMLEVNLSSIAETHGSAENLFFDEKINPFDLSTSLGCLKQLISMAAICSAKLNFALIEGVKNGFYPLADASPYMDLLGARYARAIDKLEPNKNRIQITDLSFAIFDELLPTECIAQLDIKDVVAHRKKTEKARIEFLEHLSLLQAKQTSIGVDDGYGDAIEKIIKTEIIPAAKRFRNQLQTIDEKLFGSFLTGAVTGLGSSSVLSIFTDLSWEKIMMLGPPVGVYIIKQVIDQILSERALRRECSISYVLSLDKVRY
jgi:hypothetical protein